MKMKPRDLITPTTLRQIGNNDFRIASETDIKENINLFYEFGLTKREYFAGRNLQALIEAFVGSDTMAKVAHQQAINKGMCVDDYLAYKSVTMADRLIRALNDTK